MINRWMAELVEELHKEGIDDPLSRPITLAALWGDLCHRVGERSPGILA